MKLSNVQIAILAVLSIFAYNNVSALSTPKENLSVTMSKLDFGKQGSNKGMPVLSRDHINLEWEDATRNCDLIGGRLEWDNDLKTCFQK